ncbi:MAG: hypothetical protein ACE5HV_03730 [Acidobacteriota bacterium]
MRTERGHGVDSNGSAWGTLLPLVAWWSGLAVAVFLLVWLNDLRMFPRQAIIILLLAGGVYAGACFWLHRRWPGWDPPTRQRALAVIFVGAILVRVFLLAVPPSLSDDIYRYRWDGRVQAAKLNPYSEPPASASLAPLRDPLWERINYCNIRTIYPPLTEWLFALAYRIHPDLISFQVLAIVGDLLVVILLLACLQQWKLPLWRVALYAWSPLAAVEAASNAHFDSWPIAAVLLSVYMLLRSASARSTLALTVGILLKTWPIVLVPLFLRRRPRWHLLLMAGVIAGAYLPFASAGAGLLQPWLDFTGRWLFNDAGFAVLRFVSRSQPLAKGLAAVLGLTLLQALWKRGVDSLQGSYWLLQAAILLMPAIQPWYLLWPLPLAAVSLDLGWILLTLLAPLAYWILVGAGPDSNLWVEPIWVRFVLYLPPLAIWVRQLLTHRLPTLPARPQEAS